MAAGLLLAAPAYAQNPFEEGMAAKQAGDFRKAIALFEQARAQEPENVTVLLQLGTVQGWSGRYEEALRTYELGLQLQPNDPALRLGRASVLAWSGKRERALAEVSEMVAADPENHDARVLWARIQSWRKNYAVAEGAYRTVLNAHPDHVDALEGLGDMQKWQERMMEARGFYQRALTVTPHYLELRQKMNSAREPSRWRVDFDLEHSDFAGSDRADWNDANSTVHYAIDRRTNVAVGMEQAHRFGSSDTQYGAMLGHRFDDRRAGYVGASMTRDASFLARRTYSAGGGWRIGDDGESWPVTVLLGDYRVARYSSGTAQTVWFGPQLYAARRLSATARVGATRSLNGRWAAGWQTRIDVDPAEGWHASVGYNDAAESINASMIDFSTARRTRAVLIGVAWDISAAFSLRLDFAHEAADRTPDRNVWHVGTTTRF
jgi:YaiO family outer membrane protein